MTASVSTGRQVVIFIDQQQFKIDDREYTAGELLRLAGDDPAETTLALKHGHDIKKFAPDDVIHPKNGEHFVVFHNGPTPVS